MSLRNADINTQKAVQKNFFNICEKLSDITRTRNYLQVAIQSAELVGAKKAMKHKKGNQVKKSLCDIHGEKVRPCGLIIGSKSSCFDCLQELFNREKDSFNEKSDYLGWGLRGLFEQSVSEESSDSTSTDEDTRAGKRISDARHKILRKLRRKKPEMFEPNYLDLSIDEIKKTEKFGPELRNVIKKIRGVEGKVKAKQSNSSLFQQKFQWTKEYNVYGEGVFDFANELKLKEKYSSVKFDFLTGIIHYYQKFLRSHPEEFYPSVSELMIKSGESICQDEEDIVVRYYDVLYKKGGRKKANDSFTLKHKEEQNSSDQISKEKGVKFKKCDLLSNENVLTFKRTGTVDLTNKSLDHVPSSVWNLDRDTAGKVSSTPKPSNLPIAKRIKLFKPIAHLNFSQNNIKRFYPKGIMLDTLVHLTLTNNKIDVLPDEIGNFKSLQILEIENNMLNLLPDTFCNLTTLRELNLRRNCLTELPNKFGNLKRLKSIDLRWNRLSNLPDTFEDLSSLGNLNVAYNKLQCLPLDINNLYNLIILDVSYNKLDVLPSLNDMPKLLLMNGMGNLLKEFPNFSNCRSLCEIRLDGNRIKVLITENLQDCPVVQLTLSHNKIYVIPDDFYKIETLVLLDCTNNRLKNLPWSIARLKYLTCIRVEENQITNIPIDVINAGSKSILGTLLQNLLLYQGDKDIIIRAKHELQVLYGPGDNTTVNKNVSKLNERYLAKSRALVRKRLDLTSLPKEWVVLGQKYKVTTVNLSKNKFRFIPAELKTLSLSLRELIIRENQVKSVPDFIGRMPQLVVLDLSFNCLDNLPLSMMTCRLTKLVCRKNLFTSIPKVVFMIQTIEYLDFSENMIKEIDVDGLRNLRKLYYLNLSKNDIRRLPSSLGYFVNLRQLDVTDNLFKNPGSHIVRGGTQVLMKYLKLHSSHN